MNELVGALSRNLPDYMDADSTRERFDVIKHIFKFLLSHKVVDRKGSGESNPRTQPRNVKNHYNVRYTH